mmetsp:Transcript_426/g.1236  ORF Transcript_426/g.1236 Transcript_426/m.1236 type:complete len:150 (+) Transcript_426:554-1003(+)
MSSRRERVHPFDVGAAVQACPKRVDVTVSARVVEHRSVAAHYGDCVAEELGRSARSPAAAARSAQTRACAPSLRERGTRSKARSALKRALCSARRERDPRLGRADQKKSLRRRKPCHWAPGRLTCAGLGRFVAERARARQRARIGGVRA